MNRISRIFPALLLLLVMLVVSGSALAASETRWTSKDKNGNTNVHLYMFWSKNCPHCHRSMPFVKSLAGKYPWMRVHIKEVTDNRKNLESYLGMAKELDEHGGAVPAFFFCGQMYTGWGEDETTGQWIIDTMQECRSSAG